MAAEDTESRGVASGEGQVPEFGDDKGLFQIQIQIQWGTGKATAEGGEEVGFHETPDRDFAGLFQGFILTQKYLQALFTSSFVFDGRNLQVIWQGLRTLLSESFF